MSIKKNIIASYIGQIYVALIGIIMLPLYIKYMGAEAYGLVGFFSMLQASFVLLDLGLSPTISRETARFKSGSTNLLHFLRLYRALTLIFVMIAVVGGAIFVFFADFIVVKWLTLESLPEGIVIKCVQIMGVSVALRWMCGLVRGVIIGYEHLVWLSTFNIIIATLRFVVVFFVMYIFGFKPLIFFMYQLLIAIIEFCGLLLKSRSLIPAISNAEEKIGWSFSPVKSVLIFSLSIAFTSSIWVLVTQTDKVILSGILSLSEYGYFSLAVLVASGVLVVSGPISNAIMPRMASLYASNDMSGLLSIYSKSTQLVTVLAGSVSIAVFFLAEPLLFLWTGDSELAKKSAPILTLYVLGNGVLAISAFPYYLQYALGNLKYHVIGNVIFVICLIPCVVYFTLQYGAIGAGYVWLTVNITYFLIWVTFVHKKLNPTKYINWLLNDVLKIVLPIFFIAWLGRTIFPLENMNNKWLLFLYISSFSLILLCTGVVFSSTALSVIKKRLFS